ncbi:MAG: hydrogenase 4 subunit F [Clostridia bacterium]|jgi:hydrogenase-4 component F|nr:hydrogenase 4 subunit F [Clostridia bacterium]MDD4572329.1 hydrogenase 4 subunit F [Clostridia bacterium]
MGFFLIALPVIAVLLFMLFKNSIIQHTISLLTSSLLIIIAVYLTTDVMVLGSAHHTALGGIFYIDALSIIVLDIVILIGFMASIYSVSYMETEIKHGKIDRGRLRLYYILMYAFMFTMILALTVKNMGIMWIAIEATTLASAFLVGFYNDKYSLEAAWKYVLICSVGIAIALLGIIFLHLSSIGVLENNQFLDWIALYNNAESLKSPIVKLAFIFILIGFGTKAGLAPMHTWLPDAHSQAPSPISALLSGVLLNSAMYGIIRTVAVVNRNLGSSIYTGRLLIALGILSILTAAIFILTQKDYKRLLAYSSIEHMGIIAVAMGVFTPLSVFGALLHMINHSLTKAMLFLASGNILQKYNTKQISEIKAILKLLPISGTVFLLGLFAIAGTPPFSVFASELSIMVSLFTAKKFVVGGALALLLAIIFAGIAVTLFKMFYGNNQEEELQPGETNKAGTIVIVVLFLVISISGLFIPDELKNLITQAQNIIIGA